MCREPRCILVLLVMATLSTALTGPAHAWKGATHVYLAEEALKDALDDGKVTFYITDFCTGQLRRDAAGQPIKAGDYTVNPAMLDAIRANRAQFRAGTIGPDAYPDIMVGQMVIHPAGADGPGQPAGKDINVGGPGAGPWLTYLWRMSYTPLVPLPMSPGPGRVQLYADGRVPADTAPAVRAFVAGFLAHAAADLHGHTLINYYTGAPFNFVPGPQNAIKHMVLEAYIEKHTPAVASQEISLAGGVDAFVARQMIEARPGSILKNVLLKGSGATYTVPNVYSKMRNRLDGDVKHYDAKKAEYDRRYDAKVKAANDCKPLDMSCSRAVLLAEAAAIQVEKAAYVAANFAPVTYEERWRDDIDRGLRAWPGVSHELVKALVYTPGGINKARAREVCKAYVLGHLLSMSGLPDAVGSSMAFLDRIFQALEIPGVKQAIDEMESDLANFMMKKWTGISLDQVESWMTNPESHFDEVMNAPAYRTEPGAHLVSLADFSTNQLHLAGLAAPFDYRLVPAAYNSVVMTKLALLPQGELARLARDLRSRDLAGQVGSSPPAPVENVMVGFVRTLDGSYQWNVNPERMAIDGPNYKRIFLWQVADAACVGDVRPPLQPVRGPAPASTPGLPTIRR